MTSDSRGPRSYRARLLDSATISSNLSISMGLVALDKHLLIGNSGSETYKGTQQ